MGQGEEVKTRSTPEVEIQERGEIYFFYRPKVNKEEAHSSDDVQRMYIVLRPESGETSTQVKQEEGEKEGEKEDGADPPSIKGGHGAQEVNIEKQPLLRFIVMGRKSLPDPAQKSRPFWGFVELVTTKIEDVKNALKGEEYDTAKSGHRQKPPARALGEGVYRILRHNSKKKMHTHLIYKLEFPSEEGEPQEALNVKSEGSFLVQIKNPDQKQNQNERGGGFGGLNKKRRAVFPAHLQGEFGHLRYHAADPPDFLNYEGCEFLLISASDDVEEELGLELKAEVEESQEASCSDLVKTFGETATTDALLRGIWV